MKLTKNQFEEKLKNQELVITLMGMSNIGKTHWSKKLKNLHFEHKCCDDLIEKIIEPELTAMGYKGLTDMAKWLGHPFEKQFPANQGNYLKHENSVMKKILQELENKISGNITIDTTGSVIYTGDYICNKLKEKSLIVFIEATAQMQQEMFERFLKNPKPIVWAHSFNKKEKEADMEALKRCYPELLNYRTNQYRKHADITIAYPKTNYYDSAENFLELIKNHL
ncbi:hypothetical protein HZA40_04685 [Candidatus Peregrinibacteria bacterium]|nr:hypothetical protein [Candidatus Peregrinibacteria bacterium]